MDLVLFIKAAIMGIVEGLTEFLPISSTGHLILTGSLLNFTSETAKVFDIAIQTGAMLAVLWEYRSRFCATLSGIRDDAKAQRFATNVLVAFIPAVILGLLFGKMVKAYLFHPVPVALAFIVGGLLIIWIENRHKKIYEAGSQHSERVQTVDDMTILDALKVGLIQCIALIPGMSRSGSTIMGGLLLGFTRKAAAEFSFFLGVPTLIGAGAYSLYKERDALSASDIPLFLVGTFFAAISAWVCIRWLIRYISSHDFKIFAYYRIVFGLIVLLTAYMGWVNWAE